MARPSCRCASSAARPCTPTLIPTLSMIKFSMFLIVTSGTLMPSTQDPSQGARHTRPVNWGRVHAMQTIQRFRATAHDARSFHSGMRLFHQAARGHAGNESALEQNGTPRSMPSARPAGAGAPVRGVRRRTRPVGAPVGWNNFHRRFAQFSIASIRLPILLLLSQSPTDAELSRAFSSNARP